MESNRSTRESLNEGYVQFNNKERLLSFSSDYKDNNRTYSSFTEDTDNKLEDKRLGIFDEIIEIESILTNKKEQMA